MKKLTNQEFIERSKLNHEVEYDYSLANYINQRTKVKIICDKHGEFEQLPSHHMCGIGCNECAKEYRHNLHRLDADKFIERAKLVHGDLYDYSKVNYINYKTKVLIIDDKFGEFYQTPHQHLSGEGNYKRGKYNAAKKTKNSIEQFIKAARKVHGDKYDYTKSVYKNCRTKLVINCPLHGDFQQSPISHLYSKHGCPTCGITESKIEDKIKEFLIENNIKFKERDRKIIKPFELDIVLEDYKIAIEVNGIVWHSEKFNKNKNYHINKTLKCNNVGYHLLHFFEDEINNDFDRVKDIILYAINSSEKFTDDELILDRCIYNYAPNGYRIIESTDPNYKYSKNKSRISKDEYDQLSNKNGWYKIWDCGDIICEKINI